MFLDKYCCSTADRAHFSALIVVTTSQAIQWSGCSSISFMGPTDSLNRAAAQVSFVPLVMLIGVAVAFNHISAVTPQFMPH